MKVLFLRDVPGTAQAGQVKDVKDGYARNYLMPNKLAVPATEGELKKREQSVKAEERRRQQVEDEAKALADRLSATTVTIRAKVGTGDRLYGSVTNGDIAEAIKSQFGQAIDRRKVSLDEPIRQPGEFEVAIHLTKDVAPKVKVAVVAE